MHKAVLSSLHPGVVVLYILSSPDPILALASIDKFNCLHPTRAIIDQSAQIMPGLHCIRSIIDTLQVRKYPDSTMSISKLLTILKWQMITMLN